MLPRGVHKKKFYAFTRANFVYPLHKCPRTPLLLRKLNVKWYPVKGYDLRLIICYFRFRKSVQGVNHPGFYKFLSALRRYTQ